MVEKWNPRFLNVNIPTSSRLEDYQNLVMKVESTPEMLGLSHTSIIAKNIMTCRNLLKDLRKTHINTDDTLSLERRVRPLMILWKKSVQVLLMLLSTNQFHILILEKSNFRLLNCLNLTKQTIKSLILIRFSNHQK
jgi:hypothetical protein